MRLMVGLHLVQLLEGYDHRRTVGNGPVGVQTSSIVSIIAVQVLLIILALYAQHTSSGSCCLTSLM